MSRVKPSNPVINRSHPLARRLVGAWPMGLAWMRDQSDLTGKWKAHANTLQIAAGQEISPYGWANTGNGSNTGIDTDFYAEGLDSMSVSVHVRFDDVSTWQSVIGSWWAYNYLMSMGVASDGKTSIFIRNGATNPGSYSGATTLVAGQWYHLVYCLRKNGSNLDADIYVDGVLDKTGTHGSVENFASNSTYPYRIGALRYYGGHTNAVDGAIADCKVFDKFLTASEVADLYSDPWALYRPARPVRKRYYYVSAPIAAAAGGGAWSIAGRTFSFPNKKRRF